MITIMLTLSIFTALFVLMFDSVPGFFENQTDYEIPTTRSQEVMYYFDANNITVYSQSWSFYLTYPEGYAYNQSGLPDDHRVEVFWDDDGTVLVEYPKLYFRHAFPGVLGNLWLDSAQMLVIEPFYTNMGDPEYSYTALPNFHVNKGIDKTQLLRLSNNVNSSYFIVSDGVVTQNFVVMNPGNYSSLEDAWDNGYLHVLSSYEIDFDSMKPNAFTLITQLVTFQDPDFGLPGMLGDIIGYGMSLAFWIIILLLIYTIVTGLIPTIRGGVEN
jgi:hypothetical protein